MRKPACPITCPRCPITRVNTVIAHVAVAVAVHEQRELGDDAMMVEKEERARDIGSTWLATGAVTAVAFDFKPVHAVAMSETTQILFNSPALHSLKRDQLVKLCKTHSLKANGKNVELIDRLKAHALTFPSSDPLSIATRNESDDMDDGDLDMKMSSPSFARLNMPRPSEQWEVVMDNIEEVPESDSHQGTLSSLKTIGKAGNSGEFGTGGSKGVCTTSSPVPALACTGCMPPDLCLMAPF
jgi:hypothetical protein